MSDETKLAEEAAAPALPKDYKPLSTALRFFYGVGDFGFNIMNSVENYYFVFFLTNCAMLDPVLAGLVSTIGSVIDAIVGWLWGAIINTIKPMKWGRYRSFLFIMPWFVPILFALGQSGHHRGAHHCLLRCIALLLGLPVCRERLHDCSRWPDGRRPCSPRFHPWHVVERFQDSVRLHLPARCHGWCNDSWQPEYRPGCSAS